MARQKSVLKLDGPLGDLSFYSSVYGDIVRRKGGASKQKIRQSPVFANLRRHHAEFGNCSRAGKILRQTWRPYTRQAPDHTLVWRVTQVLNQVKDQDTVSAWGERTVSKGLATPQGQALLKGFELNSRKPLKEALQLNVIVKEGQFHFRGLVPADHLVFPAGATHVRIGALVSLLNLEDVAHRLYTEEVVLARDAGMQDLVLAPVVTETLPGFAFYLLQLCFLQEANGAAYDFAESNCMAVLGVEVV